MSRIHVIFFLHLIFTSVIFNYAEGHRSNSERERKFPERARASASFRHRDQRLR